MNKVEYILSDNRKIVARYDRLGVAKIRKKDLEMLVEEVKESYNQAAILAQIINNYADIKKRLEELSSQSNSQSSLLYNPYADASVNTESGYILVGSTQTVAFIGGN